jgi:predicted nucleic acid-binding protein
MSGTQRTIVLDATPLIYLAKAGLLHLLDHLSYRVLISPEVRREVVDEGKQRHAADAFIVEREISDGVLEEREVSHRGFLELMMRIPGMDPAEGEVLTLARESKGVAIVDDRIARDVAIANRVKHAGTAFLLATLVRRGVITHEEAKEALDEMVRHGWRCSSELYSKIIQLIDEIR